MQAAGYSDVRVVFRDGANIAEAAPKRGAFLTMARIRRKATASSSPVQCLTDPYDRTDAFERFGSIERRVRIATRLRHHRACFALLVGCIAQIAKLTSSSLVRIESLIRHAPSHPRRRELASPSSEGLWRLPRRHA